MEELKKSSAAEKDALKNDYENKLEEKEKLFQEAEAEASELKDMISNLTIIADEFEKIRRENEELEKAFLIQKGKIDELKEAVAKAGEITDQNDELIKENEGLKATNNEKIDQIRELGTQIDKLQKTEAENAEKSSKIEALEKEIDSMKKEAAKFDALKEQIKHLAGDFEKK